MTQINLELNKEEHDAIQRIHGMPLLYITNIVKGIAAHAVALEKQRKEAQVGSKLSDLNDIDEAEAEEVRKFIENRRIERENENNNENEEL